MNSKKDQVGDAWLDNINWENINTFKKIDKNINEASKTSDDNKSGDDDDDTSDSDDNETNYQVEDETAQLELFEKILKYLKPSETVLKAIKRLGKTGGATSTLSASQRWSKKKNTETASTSSTSTSATAAAADKEALETLTGYANKFIEKGFYDIYEETFEKLKYKIETTKQKQQNMVDIFADDYDEKASTNNDSNQNNNDLDKKMTEGFYFHFTLFDFKTYKV
jgi:hypothetical protein